MDIEFETGLLKVTDDSISLQWDGNNVSMYRWQIGEVNIETFKSLRLDPVQYGFRLALLSIVPLIISLFVNQPILTLLFPVMILLAVIIVFGEIILGGLLGINIIYSVLLSVLGTEQTLVTVQNTSGNNLEFYITHNEKNKALSIADLYKPKEAEKKIVQPSEKGSELTDLERLFQLKERGIITEDEFEKKKAKILDI